MGDSSVVATSTTVLVTGFGPFLNHPVNASWLTVVELEKLGIDTNVKLITHKMPVEYTTVRSTVPLLWQTHSPQLVVHIGVSGIAKDLTLEQQAHNDGYDKQDVKLDTPTNHCCVDGAPCCLVSQLDMDRVSAAITKAGCEVKVAVSKDPGRYLCDFIYYTSLHINSTCVAFIHVPPIGRPYTAQQLARAVRIAIRDMLQQLGLLMDDAYSQ